MNATMGIERLPFEKTRIMAVALFLGIAASHGAAYIATNLEGIKPDTRSIFHSAKSIILEPDDLLAESQAIRLEAERLDDERQAHLIAISSWAATAGLIGFTTRRREELLYYNAGSNI